MPLDKKRKDEIFGPLHKAAGHLDSEIAAVFAIEHFREAPEHFGRMYPLLSNEQRKYVDGQLLDFLGAGGMPGMDETRLKDYLGGLLAGLTPGS